ncbi:MAG: CatB-related O-acetyltransferase [Lachnospiraceae bacterium]
MGFAEKVTGTLKAKKYKRELTHTLNVRFGPHAGTDRITVYEGDNYIGGNNYIQNCRIGRGSYIGRDTTIQSSMIGRYSSIGAEVQLLSGRHPSRDFVSTHPAFYSVCPVTGRTYVKQQKYQERADVDTFGHQLEIGNDVWIGQGAALMEGIRIGDGAIIGAGAVVTKDVEPYSVVAGVPAKEIRKRFSEEEIEWLLLLAWWNRDEEWIRANAEYFENISLLKSKQQKSND